MRAAGSSAMVLLRRFVHAASAVGVDRAQLLGRIGVTADELDRDTAVPTLVMAQAWQVAPELSGDPLFGLHAGQHAELGSYDILDYLFLTSATLGDACRALEHIVLDLVVDGNTARFRQWVPAHFIEPLRHAWDIFFSGALNTSCTRTLRPAPASTSASSAARSRSIIRLASSYSTRAISASACRPRTRRCIASCAATPTSCSRAFRRIRTCSCVRARCYPCCSAIPRCHSPSLPSSSGSANERCNASSPSMRLRTRTSCSRRAWSRVRCAHHAGARLRARLQLDGRVQPAVVPLG